MPEKNMQNSLFHELGHAHNFNNGGIMKLMQKVRPLGMLLPPFLLLYGAFSKKSKPQSPDTELTKKQKTNNFIRDNAGKLSFIAMLPILIEEGAATLKGNKFAKEFISEDLAKKAFKGNCLAYLSYLGAAVLSGLAAMTAVKIKDKKIAKKDAAMQQKMSFIQSYQSSL
jgi:hypothetical protein